MKTVKFENWKWYYEPGKQSDPCEPSETQVLVRDNFTIVIDAASFFLAVPMPRAWFAKKPVPKAGMGEGYYDNPVQLDFRKGYGFMSVIVPREEAEEKLGLKDLVP